MFDARKIKQKIDMLFALAEGPWLNESTTMEIRSIAIKAEKLNKLRNRIVHGIWGQTVRSKDRRLFYIANAKQRVLPFAQTRDDVWLAEVAEKISALWPQMWWQ